MKIKEKIVIICMLVLIAIFTIGAYYIPKEYLTKLGNKTVKVQTNTLDTAVEDVKVTKSSQSESSPLQKEALSSSKPAKSSSAIPTSSPSAPTAEEMEPMKKNIIMSPKDYSVVVKVSTLISNYEDALVKAVNTNNPSLLEPYIENGTQTGGSQFYADQKSYVEKTYKAGTKIKLVSLSFDSIGPLNTNLYGVRYTRTHLITYKDNSTKNISEPYYYLTYSSDNGETFKIR